MKTRLTLLSAGVHVCLLFFAFLLFAAAGDRLMDSSASGSSDATMKKELENFKVFIQEHPRALDELKKDPSLIRSAAFVEEHQVVREYLEQHAKVKEELKKYPNFFADLKATTQGGRHKPHSPDK
jgi:hypothetical protein